MQAEIESLCKTLAIKRLELIGLELYVMTFVWHAATSTCSSKFQGTHDLFQRVFCMQDNGLEELFGRKVDVVQAGAVKNPYVLVKPSSGIGFSCMEHNVQAYLYDIVTACRHIACPLRRRLRLQSLQRRHPHQGSLLNACSRSLENSLRRIKAAIFPTFFHKSQVPSRLLPFAISSLTAMTLLMMMWFGQASPTKYRHLTDICAQLPQ